MRNHTLHVDCSVQVGLSFQIYRSRSQFCARPGGQRHDFTNYKLEYVIEYVYLLIFVVLDVLKISMIIQGIDSEVLSAQDTFNNLRIVGSTRARCDYVLNVLNIVGNSFGT